MTPPSRTDLDTLQYIAARFGVTNTVYTSFLSELDPEMVSPQVLMPLNAVGTGLMELAQAIADEARHYGYSGPDILTPETIEPPQKPDPDEETEESPESTAHWTRWFKLRDSVILLALRNAEVFFESAPDGMSEEAYNATRAVISDELELAVREWTMHMLKPVPE